MAMPLLESRILSEQFDAGPLRRLAASILLLFGLAFSILCLIIRERPYEWSDDPTLALQLRPAALWAGKILSMMAIAWLSGAYFAWPVGRRLWSRRIFRAMALFLAVVSLARLISLVCLPLNNT